MFYHAHKISEHYRSYPEPSYERFVKKKVQFNNEKPYLFSKYARAPQGVQLEEKLLAQPRNVKFYKPIKQTPPKPLPRGADLEQLDFFEEHPAKNSWNTNP